MRKDIVEVLKTLDVKLELKNYKEFSTSDGYYMRGFIYVNGKKWVECIDEGHGGECEIFEINKINIPLEKELEKLKAYPNNKILGDEPLKIDNLFYILVTEYNLQKKLKNISRKKTLIQWEDSDYNCENETTIEYSFFNISVNNKNYVLPVLNNILKTMNEKNMKNVKIWNFTQSWKTYTKKDIENIINKENKNKKSQKI